MSTPDILMLPMLVFGIVGYVFKKLDYPLAPLVFAGVLMLAWPFLSGLFGRVCGLAHPRPT